MQDSSSPVRAMSQGALLQYVCPACKEIVQLLDGTRRGWRVYPALASLGMWTGAGGVEGSLGRAAGFLASAAALALGVSCLAFFVVDLLKRLRYPVLEEH